MAAYPALVSLMNTIDLIQNHPRYSFSFDKNQIASLSANSQFFLQFLESYDCSHGRSKEVEDLEIQIASIAQLAENILESLTVDQILAGSTPHHSEDQGQKSSSFLHNLQIKMKATMKKVKRIQEKSHSLVDLESVVGRMNSVLGKVMKAKGENRVKEKQSIDSKASADASSSVTKRVRNMVGFDGYLLQLMDILTGQESSRKIISIVGMGGIGKTTLARHVYENMFIEQHFDVRAWATISQEYDIKEILLQLLGSKGVLKHKDISLIS